MYWLIESEAFEKIGVIRANLTQDQINAMVPLAQDDKSPSGDPDRVMSVAGDVARINIKGVLTSAPDFYSRLFGDGNCVYADIISALRAAELNPEVSSIEMVFDSPGGEAQPADEVAQAIRDISKPTKAMVVSALSAAYWIASQADEVVATSRSSEVGSIGAVVTLRKPSESYSVDVSSTNAPNKRPDPETEEGRNVIRKFVLDPMHDMFVEAVAKGRKTSVDNVNSNFGAGAQVLAQQALEAGMIDSIGVPKPDTKARKSATNKTKTQHEVKTMDIEELKTSNPALFAQVMALGKEQGLTEERNRIKYHATMGEKMGAESFALKACLEGTEITDGVAQAEYLASGVNKQELNSRKSEEKDLSSNTPAPNGDEAKEKAAVVNLFSKAGFQSVDLT